MNYKNNGNGNGRRQGWRSPSKEELTQAMNQLFRQQGQIIDNSFHACLKDGCVDGWIHIPTEPGTYPGIGHVKRCECYFAWRRERLNLI